MADRTYEMDPNQTPSGADGRYVVVCSGLPVTERSGEGKWAKTAKHLAFATKAPAERALKRAQETFPEAEVVDTGAGSGPDLGPRSR